MKKKTNAKINRQPRQIKERCRPPAGQETSHIIKITQRLQTVTVAACLQWKTDERVVNARTERVVEVRSDSHIDTATDQFERALEDVQSCSKEREADQCWYALTWKDAIIDLQHEKRASEHQNVNHALSLIHISEPTR